MPKNCEQCLGYVHLPSRDRARAEVCECRTSCETCGGQRFLVIQEDGYEIAKPCDCQGIFKRVQYFNDSHVPAAYAEKSIPGYLNQGGNQGKIKTLMAHYQKHFDLDNKQGVLLIGPPGTGKTHLLCGLLNYLTLERGIRCIFVDFFELTARIKGTFSDQSGEDQEAILRPLVEVPVLAIDELGKGLGSAFEQNVIDQLISRRYNAGRIVIGTSNYPPSTWLDASSSATGLSVTESLEDRIGVRILSRLMDVCEILRIDGPDHRTAS